jgi:hypothetical protein
MTPEPKNDLCTVAAILTVAVYALEPAKKLRGVEEHDPMTKVMEDYKNFLRRLKELD